MLCYPDYYESFRCAADRCSDTCCKGWEIDIDENTLCRYRSVKGSFGKRLSECITTEGGTAHFILSRDERCPFLNDRNLCDIYIELGEAALCGICTDHPRFRSFFSDRTEIGAGLCCEEAARLILTEQKPIKLVCEQPFPNQPLERALCEIREMLFSLCTAGEPFTALRKCCALAIEMQDLLADGDFPAISERYRNFSGYSFIAQELPQPQVLSVLHSMESVSPEWDEMLLKLSDNRCRSDFSADNELLRLAEYFIFRHFPEALSDGDIVSKAYFALFAVTAVKLFWGVYLYESGTLTLTDKINGAKLFSKGAEYSEENMLRAYSLL